MSDLMFPTKAAVDRCFACKERLFGPVIKFSPPVYPPRWIGVHDTCEPAFVALVQTPYREAVRKFLQRWREVQ
jgi:hypothetical protein